MIIVRYGTYYRQQKRRLSRGIAKAYGNSSSSMEPGTFSSRRASFIMMQDNEGMHAHTHTCVLTRRQHAWFYLPCGFAISLYNSPFHVLHISACHANSNILSSLFSPLLCLSIYSPFPLLSSPPFLLPFSSAPHSSELLHICIMTVLFCHRPDFFLFSFSVNNYHVHRIAISWINWFVHTEIHFLTY